MPVNADKPHLWKLDIVQSVDFYNNWFMQFAPQVYRDTRLVTTKQVKSALEQTVNLTNITPAILRQYPSVLPILRMATAPPIARDRLIGLAGVSSNLVKNMEEKQRIPPRTDSATLDAELKSAGDYTNPNKRRKEEAVKMTQLRSNYGENVRFILFLCGYFDSGYLGYEAAEGIDWVWEHRIDDLGLFGI